MLAYTCALKIQCASDFNSVSINNCFEIITFILLQFKFFKHLQLHLKRKAVVFHFSTI